MDRTAFLGTFRRHLDDLEKFQGFIDKAKSQQGKFAASIVEKVINDNTAKVQTLAETILPLTMDVESEIAVHHHRWKSRLLQQPKHSGVVPR